jgi:DNA repair exonuclease SbcCD nuclease subunit
MTRFLHTADWQLGHQYRQFPNEDSVALAEARLEVIPRLALLATEKQVDAVLVAGDVFDAQTVSERTLHRAFQALAGFAGPWIFISGNHDAALAESVWTHAHHIHAVPANAKLLLTRGITPFPDLGFVVLAAPLTQRETYDDLTAWFDDAPTPEGLLRIGLAHGSVTGHLPEAADAGNPIAANRAETAHLDYLALGDWHGMKRINDRVWYSGTPEQDRFKENGAGQALLVEIDGPGAVPKVEPQPTGRHRWVNRNYDLAVESDVATILNELEQLPRESVVDLTMRGTINLAGRHRLWDALAAASGRHRSLASHFDGLRLEPTAEELSALHADGYVNEVIAELQAEQVEDGPGVEVAREALGLLAELLQHGEGGAAA